MGNCNTGQTGGSCSSNESAAYITISNKKIIAQLDDLEVVLDDMKAALAELCDEEGANLQLISGILSEIIEENSECCALLVGKLITLKTTITNNVHICDEVTTTTTIFSELYPCGIYRITNNTGVPETIYYRECEESTWLEADVNPGILEFVVCYELLIYNPLLDVLLIDVCVPTTTTSTTEEPGTTTTSTTEETSTTTTEGSHTTTEEPPLPDEIALDLYYLKINSVFDTALDYHLYIRNGTSNNYSTQARVRNTTTGSWNVIINTFVSYAHTVTYLTGTTAKLNYANTNGDTYVMEFSTDGGSTWTGITYNGTGTLPFDYLL